MRFDIIQREYPQFLDILRLVSGYIHSGVEQQMVVGFAQGWIKKAVRKEHQEAVSAKVLQFIEAIR